MLKVIITGCPGSGKSTLVQALRQRGALCFDEVARPLIAQYRAQQSGMARHPQIEPCSKAQSKPWPWQDMAWYAPKVVANMQKHVRQAEQSQAPWCVFDRGLPDLLAYFSWQGLRVDSAWKRRCQAMGYAPQVLLLPPWKAIYRNDAQRPQSYGEACMIQRHLIRCYRDLGFELIPLPRTDIETRAEAALKWLQHWSRDRSQRVSGSVKQTALAAFESTAVS